MEQQQARINPGMEDGFERGRSVQAWQCFPDGGSLSSIDSMLPIEDDESGTDPGFLGSPAIGRLDYNLGQNRSREEPTSCRVKLMCSFGGRIMPRPSDGKLRYVGGETRIVRVKRDVTYAEIMLKMKKHYGEDLSLKYQLPKEDLDALISVSTDEDLQNMMEEYDRLEDGDGLHRLRVFLFSVADSESVSVDCLDPKKSELWYVEAINGLLETGSRKSESGVSGGGLSGGGLSARPSAENLVALDTSMEEHAMSRKIHGAFNSASSSPALASQQPYSRHLGGHAYGDGQQNLGNVNTDVGHFDMDHYYHRHDLPQDYDRVSRFYPQEKRMPRVGSHGKLSRLHEQLDDVQQPPDLLDAPQDYDCAPRFYPQEKRMPRVGSHGKLSRLHEQQFDDVQQPPDLLSQDPYVEPRTRFLPTYQHPLEVNQDHRRSEIFHADSGCSHPSQLQYTPTYKGEPYYRHQLPDDYIAHHHQDDYYLAHMYQSPGDIGMGSHPAAHQTGSSPSSPPLKCCDARVYPQLALHRWNPVERQYGARLHPRDEAPQGYRFSPSPPRFRNHHFDEQMPFLHHERFPPTLGLSDQKFAPSQEYGYREEKYGYQEDLLFHQENSQKGGNQIQNLSALKSRLEDETVKLEHFSLDHSQDQLEHKMYQLSNNNTLSGITTDGSSIQTQQLSQSHGLPVFDTISQWNSNFRREEFEGQLLPSIGISVSYESYESRAETGEKNENISIQGGNDISHIMSETGILAEDMASSILRSFPTSTPRIIENENSSMLNEKIEKSDILPQSTFIHPVQEPELIELNWDKDLLQVENNIENDLYKHQGSHDKVENNVVPIDISLVAEQEAKSLGLQIIKNSDLEEIRELGSGTYGTVYHGKWRGTDVAIKRIKASCFEGNPSERERLILDFWREAGTLSNLHHPNVVAFYGVVPDSPGETLATVTEYMVNGSLKQVLQKKDRTIDRRKRLLIATDAAFGMEYLHGKNIVHFDLKCENLLVNMRDPHRPVCKVGDLGLSKVKRQTMVSGGVRGTLPWMAPELLSMTNSKVTERVDVFSFGIVMWELLTGEEPYANMHYGAIIGGIVSNTLRPPIPSWCEPAWRSLMERCWNADPSVRPSFAEIANELRSMSSSVQPKT